VLGLGLGLGQEVMLAMSHLRGGNAFSFTNSEHVERFMTDDWPWFTSPIAYDLSLHVATTAGYRAADAYGFPANADGEVGFDVATVFLSRRKGALLVRIENEQAEELGDFRAVGHLAYEALDGALVTQDLEGAYAGEPLDERGQYFEQPSVAKTTALALLVSGMQYAAGLYQSDPWSATEYMLAVVERFDADTVALGDTALEPEVTLAHDLLTLMENRAPQGTLYP
jgi:Ca-activated chloride channel family protein